MSPYGPYRHWLCPPRGEEASDKNERSVSSASSAEPVAWVAFAADASESRAVCLTRQEAENVCRPYGWRLSPLYAVRLTDAERDVMEWLSAAGDETRDTQKTLTPVMRSAIRGLLERTKRPRNARSGAPHE